MNKLILLAVVIVVFGGGWYYWTNRTAPEVVVETPTENIATTTPDTASSTPALPRITVNMTDDGFEPSTLVIKKGQIIEFVNVGKDFHWPASDLHPTHEIYSEFDSDKPVGPGETYSFQFERIGKWNMHDHLHARFRGSIEVQQ
ncbi:cupredoxin domain-containing protein [Candidatus Parcubacteria bacterium]|nr:cupredoxin domain-containing protein [Candidatus Parcubacteria bacterium]